MNQRLLAMSFFLVLAFHASFDSCAATLTWLDTDRSEPSTVTEQEAVERAVLDYVEGIYEVKPELIERSVSKELKKFGFWRPGNESDFKDGTTMTYEQLKQLSANYNKNGRIPKSAPKKVQVFDVMDKIACAKLTAHWGSDYFQLVKTDGKWKIRQIVWQSPPQKEK